MAQKKKTTSSKRTSTSRRSSGIAKTASRLKKLGSGALEAVQKAVMPANEEYETVRGLFEHELKDLYSAENQLLKALPKMRDKATNPALKNSFNTHLKQTQEHVRRLDKIAGKLKFGLGGVTCKAMEGLIKEGNEVISGKGDSRLIDSALIAAAQRVEHYEMAAYGCARTMAQALSLKEVTSILQTTLNEEGKTDKLLTSVAETKIFPALLKKGSRAN